MAKDREAFYVNILVTPIRVCASYKPKLGQGGRAGLTLQDFQAVYGADPFYSWFGLDNPLMYAAHKAAGGMTSVYRQIGIGCERLFRQILQDELQLTLADTWWSYAIPGAAGKARTLSLDGRIPLDAVQNPAKRKRIRDWMDRATADLQTAPAIAKALEGVVFEVRQGYKSKDSKRQNADVSNAASAYSKGYLPAVVLLSGQIDSDVASRYTAANWVLLRGITGAGASDLVSTYSFMSEIIGYDLAGFFGRNSKKLRHEVERVLEALLRSE